MAMEPAEAIACLRTLRTVRRFTDRQCRNRCWTTCSASPAGVAAPRTFNPGSSSSSATGTRCDGWRRWRIRRPPRGGRPGDRPGHGRQSRPGRAGDLRRGGAQPAATAGRPRARAGIGHRLVPRGGTSKRPRLSSASRPSGWCGPPSPLATRMSAPRAPAPIRRRRASRSPNSSTTSASAGREPRWRTTGDSEETFPALPGSRDRGHSGAVRLRHTDTVPVSGRVPTARRRRHWCARHTVGAPAQAGKSAPVAGHPPPTAHVRQRSRL